MALLADTWAVDRSQLIVQSDQAPTVARHLADCGLGLSRVVPSTPSHGFATLAVGEQQPPVVHRPLLVVGERHRTGSFGPAFSGSGSSARRLAMLLGAPVLEVATTANLANSHWDPLDTRRAAVELRQDWDGWIVACGRRAAAAFGLDDFLTWHGTLGAIPHPSGRCRYWNDPDYVAATQAFLVPASNFSTNLQIIGVPGETEPGLLDPPTLAR